jgi:hypothetical protein
MKKIIKGILHFVSCFLTGAIIKSLWISPGDDWKILLPLFCICITLINAIDLDDAK